MKEFAENIWTFEEEAKVAPAVHFPMRMTAMRLTDGSVVLHSPIKISAEVAEQIRQIGPVRYIAAPNLFHHLFILDALKLFPEAELYIADGLEKKRKDLKNYKHLSQAPTEWGEDIELTLYEGIPMVGEYVFLHKKSRTLITTDVVFNIECAKNWVSRMLFKLDGIYQQISQGRLLKLITKDRKARQASMEKIIELDFDKVLMAHGPPIIKDAKAQMRKACLPKS